MNTTVQCCNEKILKERADSLQMPSVRTATADKTLHLIYHSCRCITFTGDGDCKHTSHISLVSMTTAMPVHTY